MVVSTKRRNGDDHEIAVCGDPLLCFAYDFGLIAHWIQSCSGIREIRKIHAWTLKNLKDSYVFLDNNLISGYVKCGELVEARKVFDKMLDRNVVSWTAMLNGYVKFGFDAEALRFFDKFVENGFSWNSKTFVCAMQMCGKIVDFELGKQIHACILKSGFSGLILDSSVLYFYVQFGNMEKAACLFDMMKERDVICWTTMITGYSQHGQGDKAFRMFSLMLLDGVEPNEYTVCSLLDACGEEAELKLGRSLHGSIVKRMCEMDIFVGTSLVDMYAKCGEMEDSKLVFDGMRKKNIVTWTSLITGYARNALGKEALAIFQVMQRQRIRANNLTMVSILRACGLLRVLASGKEVHAQIIKNQVQKNIYLGSSLVWFYCCCGNYSTAAKVLQDMPFRDVVSWTAMISGCANLGHEYEALEYLREMVGEGIEPNPFTYSSALKACANVNDVKQGKLIHSSINKSPASSNVFVASALIHMYGKCGHLSEAIQVFGSMTEQNLVSWKAMIIAYARNGLCREAFKLMYRMQAEGIEMDDYILSTVLSACGDAEWDIESSLKPELGFFTTST